MENKEVIGVVHFVEYGIYESGDGWVSYSRWTLGRADLFSMSQSLDKPTARQHSERCMQRDAELYPTPAKRARALGGRSILDLLNYWSARQLRGLPVSN